MMTGAVAGLAGEQERIKARRGEMLQISNNTFSSWNPVALSGADPARSSFGGDRCHLSRGKHELSTKSSEE